MSSLQNLLAEIGSILPDIIQLCIFLDGANGLITSIPPWCFIDFSDNLIQIKHYILNQNMVSIKGKCKD